MVKNEGLTSESHAATENSTAEMCRNNMERAMTKLRKLYNMSKY